MLTVRQMLGEKTIKGVITVRPDSSVMEALVLMEKNNIGMIVVMRNESCCPLGVFSHKDNTLRVVLKSLDPNTTQIMRVMTQPDFTTVTPETQLEECVGLMAKEGVNHLLVMDGEGEYLRIIGVISNKDIEREMIAHKEFHQNEFTTLNENRT